MSEIITEAVAALTPEAEAALKDAHAFVTAEMDKFRQALPALEQQAVAHVQAVSEEALSRGHAMLAHFEAMLGIGTTPTAPAAPAPAALVEDVPSAPAAVDPTPAPSTTEASSAPSSVTPDASSDTTATPEAPAQA